MDKKIAVYGIYPSSISAEKGTMRMAPKKNLSTRVKSLLIAGGIVSALSLHSVGYADNTHSGTESVKNEEKAASFESDNTGRNVRDRNEYRKTAENQSNTKKEIEVSAEIRRELVAQDTFSTNAKNVKVIVEPGIVTLRGPVKTTDERQAVENIATRIANGYKVVNQLEIIQG